MVSRTDIEDAIRADPVRAEQALKAIQGGVQRPVTLEALRPVADERGMSLESMLAFQLEKQGLLEAYGVALAGRETAAPMDRRFSNFSAFERVGKAAACRIVLDNDITGSGCLIGPSLVLTAWHVIASGAPDTPDPVRKPISVLLADETRRSVLKVSHYLSPCTIAEFANQFPANDADFADCHDVALLRLSRPDGMRLNFLRVPDVAPRLPSQANVFVLDFPDGRPSGWGIGRVEPIAGFEARVPHDSLTNGGSSGAACVNTRYELVGIHQGRWEPARRLVPLTRFHGPVMEQVRTDVAPRFLWSLTDTLDGQLVIGRDLFFEGVAEASRPGGRVRGVRVSRMNLTAGTTGLAFSAALLETVLDRDPGRHLLIRLGFDQPLQDLLGQVRRRAAEAGLALEPDAAPEGARAGDTTPEAAAGDEARRLAQALDAAVLAKGPDRLLWFFFENPATGLTEGERIAFEAFVDAALKQPGLRMVIAGFETISTPGEEFADAGAGASEGPPGLVVEYVGHIKRREVEILVERAGRALQLDLGDVGVRQIANPALRNLPSQNGVFDVAHSVQIVTVVRERLVDWLDAQGERP
ncbi:hypothetical protein DDF65_23550 [Caulobacter radicis]|uniref:Serine protease n=2 Tax=Caulobacter radicis TaxID=2172650 RepID=A0A2T9IXC5_9CAUL|nr:hypothetical protein DDF65_23550 [Caulobacter radicis]